MSNTTIALDLGTDVDFVLTLNGHRYQVTLKRLTTEVNVRGFRRGDRVRLTTGHTLYQHQRGGTPLYPPGTLGTVLNVDTGDDTLHVMVDGKTPNHWFKFDQVERV